MNATQAASPATAKPHAPAKDPRRKTQQLDELMQLMRSETGKAIDFEIAAHPDSRVYIAGSFNNWNPTTHPLRHHPEEGVFRATLMLPAGTHEYKFVVNGVWHLDTKCPHWVPNEHGTLNSVAHV